MKSLSQKIMQVHGLYGTTDVTGWENNFIESIWIASQGGTDTQRLTDKQVEIIDRIWGKHFA